jgi:hypothetical protein
MSLVYSYILDTLLHIITSVKIKKRGYELYNYPLGIYSESISFETLTNIYTNISMIDMQNS